MAAIGFNQDHGTAQLGGQKTGIPTIVAAHIDNITPTISLEAGVTFLAMLGPLAPKVH